MFVTVRLRAEDRMSRVPASFASHSFIQVTPSQTWKLSHHFLLTKLISTILTQKLHRGMMTLINHASTICGELEYLIQHKLRLAEKSAEK